MNPYIDITIQCSNLLLPYKQNDSQSNLFHYPFDKYQDPYAYDNCRDIDWANHHKKTAGFCTLHILDTPDNQIEVDKRIRETAKPQIFRHIHLDILMARGMWQSLHWSESILNILFLNLPLSPMKNNKNK